MATEDPANLKNPAELALELYNILLPYPSDVRQRAIQSAVTSLGDAPVSQQPSPRGHRGRFDQWLDRLRRHDRRT